MKFTINAIKNQIKWEEEYIRSCEEQMLNLDSNIRCSKKAIDMWKKDLAKLEKAKAKKTNCKKKV